MPPCRRWFVLFVCILSSSWSEIFPGDLFRTDAKCDSGKVTFGGYHLQSGQWFALSVGPSEAPYLFKENGDSHWASAPAELLAVMVALWSFGFLKESSERRSIDLWVQGGTDNRSIDQMVNRAATTRWPLVLVNMQLSDCLMGAGLLLVWSGGRGMSTRLLAI